MEKFLLILRENGVSRSEQTPDEWHAIIQDLMEWIHLLSKSANYCSGAPISITGQYVGKGQTTNDKSFGVANERILRYDVVMAESINQAVSIAQTCPLVIQGLAEMEVRMILALTR